MLERLSVELRGNVQQRGAVPALGSEPLVAGSLSAGCRDAQCPGAARRRRRQSSGAGPWGRLGSELSTLVILLIRIYQWLLSPLLGQCCRFEPSCSRYTISCIERGGVLRGLWWGVRRILRCHPFSAGGHDPPPEFSA